MIIEVETHGGRTFTCEVESYIAQEINDKLNDPSVSTVLIGQNIFSKVDVKYIGPIEEVELHDDPEENEEDQQTK